MKEQVILVDERNNELGFMEKLDAHREGRLHRAISVFIFNENQELLLQKRADHKYHSGGLWTNTCCTHPRPGETTIEASNRRLFEEMGVNVVITANHMLRAAYPAMLKVAKSVLENGRSLEAEPDCMSIKEILEFIPGTK